MKDPLFFVYSFLFHRHRLEIALIAPIIKSCRLFYCGGAMQFFSRKIFKSCLLLVCVAFLAQGCTKNEGNPNNNPPPGPGPQPEPKPEPQPEPKPEPQPVDNGEAMRAILLQNDELRAAAVAKESEMIFAIKEKVQQIIEPLAIELTQKYNTSGPTTPEVKCYKESNIPPSEQPKRFDLALSQESWLALLENMQKRNFSLKKSGLNVDSKVAEDFSTAKMAGYQIPFAVRCNPDSRNPMVYVEAWLAVELIERNVTTKEGEATIESVVQTMRTSIRGPLGEQILVRGEIKFPDGMTKPVDVKMMNSSEILPSYEEIVAIQKK